MVAVFAAAATACDLNWSSVEQKLSKCVWWGAMYNLQPYTFSYVHTHFIDNVYMIIMGPTFTSTETCCDRHYFI
jgi:hypothetical protein